MSKVKLVTHNGSFHTDDLFACATLVLLMQRRGERYEILRSRDKETLDNGDIVFDVGGVYDPGKNRFDHHQKEGAGGRENGIPYSSFGLVWKHFGMELCDEDEKVWELIDKKIVSPIDAVDNGVDIIEPKFEDIYPYSASRFYRVFSPTWREKEKNIDEIFVDQVKHVVSVMDREIKVAVDDAVGADMIQKAYNEAEDKRVVILPNYFPRYLYQSTLARLSEPIYTVYESRFGEYWNVEAINERPETMVSRKAFPESWRGIMEGDGELAKITGVDDVLFCHRSGFLLTVKSKEGALTLAKKALES